MSRWLVRFTVFITIVASAVFALAESGGPNASKTGAPALGSLPAESNCRSCHTGNSLNVSGALQILDFPTLYHRGVTYRLRVSLASTALTTSPARQWGFQLTSVDATTGAGVGTFSDVAGQNTQTLAGSGSLVSRGYIEHTGSGTRTGQASPAVWLVDWTAPTLPDPNTPGPAIKFFASAIYSDGTGGTGGDFVYTTGASMTAAQDTVTATTNVSWGRLKSLWR